MMIQKKYKILANLSEPQSLILLSKRDEQIIGYIGAWGCGKSFTAGSTKKLMKVEVCSQCHPFFTGEQRIVDTAGRVERFKRRYNMK